MSHFCFLVANSYQLHHVAPVAVLLDDVTIALQFREDVETVDEDSVRQLVPAAAIERIGKGDLHLLDGSHDVIVCQTPPLLHCLLTRSRTVVLQYGLGKERYNYGAWRALADLNVVYGPHSEARMRGHARTTIAGCVLFDAFFAQESIDDVRPPVPRGSRPRVLYSPTYGELSSLASVLPRLEVEDTDLTVKLHHQSSRLDIASSLDLAVLDSTADPVRTIRSADVVLSDHSGAIYDALYARVPVVLTSAPLDHGSTQLAGPERHQIERLVAVWEPGEPFGEVWQRARDAIENDDRYRTFADTYFAWHGQAASRCAEAIESARSNRLPPHFNRDVVAERLTTLIQSERDLNNESRRLRRELAALQTTPWRMVQQLRFNAEGWLRRAVAPHPRTMRLMGKLSHLTRSRLSSNSESR